MPGSFLSHTHEQAEHYLREAMGEESGGDKWDEGVGRGDEGDDKGDEGDKGGGHGEEGREEGGNKVGGHMQGEQAYAPATLHHVGGAAFMLGLANGVLGANRANWANPPSTDPAPAHQVTFQVTYWGGWGGGGANQAKRGVGAEGGGGWCSVSWVQHRDPLAMVASLSGWSKLQLSNDRPFTPTSHCKAHLFFVLAVLAVLG